MTNKLRKILFFLFLILLALPLLQFKALYHYIHIEPLNGPDERPGDTALSFSNWFSDSYQERKEKTFNHDFGFRGSFIRLNNQLQWSLFRNISNNRLVLGKEDFINYKPYIDDYRGTDFVGIDKIKDQINKLQYIADTLEKLNKKLILIFAPNKSDIYSELLPDSLQIIKGPTNYDVYIKLLKENRINFIDFNSYFKSQKNKSSIPLFSPFGSHFSVYGACIAGDSVIRYIEKLTGKELPHSVTDKIDMAPPHFADADLMDLMNLMYIIHSKNLYAYPASHIITNSRSYKPNVLILGDSYFGMLIRYYHILDCFSENTRFWRNNQTILAGSQELQTPISDINSGKEIMKYDVVIVMTSLGSLYSLGWGFVDNTYSRLKH